MHLQYFEVIQKAHTLAKRLKSPYDNYVEKFRDREDKAYDEYLKLKREATKEMEQKLEQKLSELRYLPSCQSKIELERKAEINELERKIRETREKIRQEVYDKYDV